MLSCRAILITLLCALSAPALAQTLSQRPLYVERSDHQWIVQFHSKAFGLAQYTDIYSIQGPDETFTTVYFWNLQLTIHTSVWPILAVLAIFLGVFIYFVACGIASFLKPAEKHTP